MGKHEGELCGGKATAGRGSSKLVSRSNLLRMHWLPLRDVVVPCAMDHGLSYEKPQAAFAGFWICRCAAATTWSVVNPNFFWSSLRGAEAPNDVMPMISPVSPA